MEPFIEPFTEPLVEPRIDVFLIEGRSGGGGAGPSIDGPNESLPIILSNT